MVVQPNGGEDAVEVACLVSISCQGRTGVEVDVQEDGEAMLKSGRASELCLLTLRCPLLPSLLWQFHPIIGLRRGGR